MTVFRAATLRTFFFRFSRGSKRVKSGFVPVDRGGRIPLMFLENSQTLLRHFML